MTDGPFTRDRWSRPLLPHPMPDGEPVWHWRPSSIGGQIADRYGIELWKRRMVIAGAAARPDLVLTAATLDPDTDKKQLDRVADECAEAAGSTTRANIGTALHRYTELLDTGSGIEPLDEYAADLDAYRQCIDLHSIEIDPDWIEVPLVWSEKRIAGTIDRLVNYRGALTALDLKTGRHNPAKYSMVEHAAQLACYANASHRWDPDTETATETPEINTDTGLILWLPAGEGHAELVEVDLAFGARMVDLAVEVYWARKNRDSARTLSRPHLAAVPASVEVTSDTSDPVADSAIEPELGRLGSLSQSPEPAEPVEEPRPEARNAGEKLLKADGRTAQTRRALSDLDLPKSVIAERWPTDVPYLTSNEPITTEHFDRIDAMIQALRIEHGLDPADPADVAALLARLDALPSDLADNVSTYAMARTPPPPNLRHGTPTVDDLDHVTELVDTAEDTAAARIVPVIDALFRHGPDDRTSLIGWATEQRDVPFTSTDLLVGLEPLEIERVLALADLNCSSEIRVDDLLDELLALCGNRTSIVNAAKFQATRHNLTKPKSAADVAGDLMLTALVIQQQKRETS